MRMEGVCEETDHLAVPSSPLDIFATVTMTSPRFSSGHPRHRLWSVDAFNLFSLAIFLRCVE
jgi:hypothetical protein